MNKHAWKFYLFVFCLCFSCNHLRAEPGVSALPFASGETLHYKLSYRGLLTSMIWADIADASMTFLANQQALDTYHGHQFILSLSTENYAKAEMIQPVRYTYTATLDQSLQKTLLVEKVDRGAKQRHDFLWLDWHNKTIELFKKREKILSGSGFFDLENKQVWEQDGELALPDFLSGFPMLEQQQSYFIHKESGDKIDRSQILEPLSLIYHLRTEENDNAEVSEIAVAISDDIRLYRIQRVGLQSLQVAGKSYQTIKYKIQSREKNSRQFYIWLHNNSNKIPVRLSMDAPLGKLTIDLVKVSHTEDTKSRRLGSRADKPVKKDKSS